MAYVLIFQPPVFDLEMDSAFHADVRRVRAHAEKPENVYCPGPDVPPPGKDPRFTFDAAPYRVVYSLAAAPHRCLRYLSISDRRKRYPDVTVGMTIAHHLGFTGATPNAKGIVATAPPDWITFHDEDEGTLVLQQNLLPDA